MDRLRVLVVDDEEEFVVTLVERLEMRGIASEGVTHGREALARLSKKEYDVILLDVKMPGIGGLEVIKKIKTDHPKVQVILLTGHGSAEDARDGMASGAFDYLMKPVNIDDLIQVFHKASENYVEAPETKEKDVEGDLHSKNLAFMGAITASLSHEINNVITIINELSGLLDDLIKGAAQGRPIENEKLKGISEKIAKHVARGESFIKLLNRFAHCADEPISSVDSADILGLITALCQRFANLKRVKLEMVPAERSTQIETNPFMLQHAIYLCISTALESTARDEAVTVDCAAQDAGCRFRVETPGEINMKNFTESRSALLASLMNQLSGKYDLTVSAETGSVFSITLPKKMSGV